MNKRGDLSIVLLVITTVIISGAALFSFVINLNGFETHIMHSRFLDVAYGKEDQIKFYLEQAGENSIAKSYNQMAKEGTLFGETNPMKNGILILNNFDKKSAEKMFLDKLNFNFPEEIKKYPSKSASIEFSDGLVKIKVENFLISTQLVHKTKVPIEIWFGLIKAAEGEKLDVNMAINYMPDNNFVTINLTEKGLDDFGKIYTTAEKCKGTGAYDCFKEELPNFLEESENKGEYNLITLTSKKKFNIDGNFKNIAIKFLIPASN